MSHLLAGTPEELREAARQLGLSAHVQRPGTAKEHLDLSESKLREGLRMGAVEVTGRQLAEIIRSKRSPGGHGTLTVDAGAMLPGDTVPSGRRQEVQGAIRYIVQRAGEAAN